MKKSDKGKPAPSYARNFEEIQKILEALEQGDIDVDDLSAKVKRAAELIDLCQKRLRETEIEVKRVVDRFGKALPETEDQ